MSTPEPELLPDPVTVALPLDGPDDDKAEAALGERPYLVDAGGEGNRRVCDFLHRKKLILLARP